MREGGLQRDEDCKVVLSRSTRGKGAEECCRCGEPLWWCKSVGVLRRHKRLVVEPAYISQADAVTVTAVGI